MPDDCPSHPFDARTRISLDRPQSRKWSLHPGRIGAWVAEMDFGVAPVVAEALHRAIDDENLGYLSPPQAAELGEATLMPWDTQLDPSTNSRLQQELVLLVQGDITAEEFLTTMDDTLAKNAPKYFED